MRNKYLLSLILSVLFICNNIPANNSDNHLDYFVPTLIIRPARVFNIHQHKNLIKLKTPVLIFPGKINKVDTIFTTTPVFKWKKVPDAESHLLRIYKKISPNQYSLIFNSAFYLVIVDTTFRMISGMLKENETYLWYVKALNEHAVSKWSEPREFTIKSGSNKIKSKNVQTYEPIQVVTQPEPEEKAIEEVFLTFKYGNVVNIPIIAYLKNDSLFLPFKTLFSALKIYFENNPDNKTLSGFYIKPVNKYKLDFKKNIYFISGNTAALKKDDYYLDDFSDEYYLSIDAFRKIFGMEFKANYRKLILRLNSRTLLPVYERELSLLNFNIYKNNTGNLKYGRFFPSRKDIFNFGFFDYNISSTLTKNNSNNSSYYFGLSSALLGGEANVSFNGTAIKGKVVNDRIDWNWRYGMFNDYLTQIVLGNYFTQGLSSYNLRGISLTNEPLEARRRFTKVKIESMTHPYWQVEMYKNNIPLDFTTADEKGRFAFELPLNYGMTYVKFRYLGTKGEIYEKEKLYHIPYDLIPPKEFNYHINLGQTPFTNIKIAQADAIYGINKWLTNKLGVDYIKSGNYNKGIVYDALTAKITTEYLVNLLTAPGAYYRLNFSGIFPSLSSFDFSYTHYSENSFFNPVNIKNEVNASVYYPLNYSELPINLFGFMQYLNFENNGERKNFRFGINSTFYRFSHTLTYEYFNSANNIAEFTRSVISTGFFYSLPNLPGIFKTLFGSVLSFKLSYNLNSGKAENMFLALSTNIFSNTRLQIIHNRNFPANISNTALQLIVDFSFTRSTTTLTNSQLTQNLSGSLGYDNNYSTFHPYNRFQQGKSAAVINCFVDVNGNSKYDPGEKNIKGLKIKFNNLSGINYSEDGKILVSELIPYSVYHAKLIDTKVQNPLLIPKFKKFSFVADPNKYKRIDIPFYYAGEVDGEVKREGKNEILPVSGIPVVIENITTHEKKKFNSFSDGSFYYFGLLPGKYKVYIDEKILKKIAKTVEPEYYKIEVKSVETGEYFDNLNFLLK